MSPYLECLERLLSDVCEPNLAEFVAWQPGSAKDLNRALTLLCRHRTQEIAVSRAPELANPMSVLLGKAAETILAAGANPNLIDEDVHVICRVAELGGVPRSPNAARSRRRSQRHLRVPGHLCA